MIPVYIVLSLAGLSISLYIVLYRIGIVKLYCPKGRIVDCKSVLGVNPAIFGVPTAICGAAFFLVGALLYNYPVAALPLVFYNSAGLLLVAWLIGIQVRLRAVCIYCVASHAIIIALFMLSVYQSVLSQI